MEPTPELLAALRRDKIEAARRMSPEQKLMAGPELFDCACEAARAGIRMQHPEADEARVRQLLAERVRLSSFPLMRTTCNVSLADEWGRSLAGPCPCPPPRT